MKSTQGQGFVAGLCLALVAGALIFAAVANGQTPAAANPTVDGYGGTGGGIQTAIDHEGGLPFTGADLAYVAFVGFILVVLGLLLLRPAKGKR